MLQPRRLKSLYRRQNTTPREVVEARMMLEREATAEELEALGRITAWMAHVHTPR